MQKFYQKVKFLPLLCLTITFIVIFTSPTLSGFASPREQDINAISSNTGADKKYY